MSRLVLGGSGGIVPDSMAERLVQQNAARACPFCGYKGPFTVERFDAGSVAVHCYACDAQGSPRPTEEAAYAAWGRTCGCGIPLENGPWLLCRAHATAAADPPGDHSRCPGCRDCADGY